ncbi:MAG: nuclear transport factor 2 family protein [Sandaracinaceae bacterium]
MSLDTVTELAARQLNAYNRADLDAFCGCYHEDVSVLAEDGSEIARGQTAFRARYESLFATRAFGATVETRVSVGVHCVDHERYWREADGAREEGEVIVRYRLRDGRIDEVQFFR